MQTHLPQMGRWIIHPPANGIRGYIEQFLTRNEGGATESDEVAQQGQGDGKPSFVTPYYALGMVFRTWGYVSQFR